MHRACKMSRRQVLLTGAALPLAGCGSSALVQPDGQAAPNVPDAPSMPPPEAGDRKASFRAPGLVVEVNHPGVVSRGVVRADEVAPIVERGMRELTGASTLAAAWQAFFSAED